MKFKDIIEKFKRTKENENQYLDVEEIANEMNLQLDFDYEKVKLLENHLKSYWFIRWLCTDTWVGTKLYFFDDEFVFLTNQTGRKCGMIFEWKDENSFKLIQSEILKCVIVEEQASKCDLINMEEDYDLFYDLDFTEQVIGSEAYYLDELVQIVDKPHRTSDGKTNFREIYINVDGKTIMVDVRSLKFKCLGM